MFNFYFKQDFSGFDRSALLAVMTAFVIFSAVAAAIGIVLYILRAVGIYKMSKTAGLEYPWLSFIPVASSYTLGRLAEKYRKSPTEKPFKYSILLLVMHIIEKIVATVFFVLFCFISVETVRTVISVAMYDGEIDPNTVLALIPFFVLSIAVIFTELAFAVIKYIALWRVYSLFDGRNAVLYTVLSVLFGFLEPVFIFVLRNKQPVYNPYEQ